MAARCRRFPATAAEGKRGDVSASQRGLGQATAYSNLSRPWPGSGVGLTTDTHPSDSLPSTQAIQTAAAAARQWSGWREIVPCDGLMARLHDACCSGARFNFYPQSITAPGKNSLHAGGGIHPPSPPLYPPLVLCVDLS